jgi:uncharacterized protein YndB with AHSA1/START domain
MSDAAARSKPATDALALTYERVFDAPRAKVFKAWTDPSILAKWWGPKQHTIPKVDMDLREGGTWATVMRSPAGDEIKVGGTYRKIDPPARLSFTWAWIHDGKRGHESVVTVDFEDQGPRTLMRFHQGAFESAEAAAMHNQGWTSTWEKLDDFIAAKRLK